VKPRRDFLTQDQIRRLIRAPKGDADKTLRGNVRLPDLRQEIAKCERRSMLDQCGAYFVDLKPRR